MGKIYLEVVLEFLLSMGTVFYFNAINYTFSEVVWGFLVLVGSVFCLKLIGQSFSEVALGYLPIVASWLFLITMKYGLSQILLATLIFAGSYFYFWMRVRLLYWRVKGVEGPRPLPFVGNFLAVSKKTQAPFQLISEMYEDYKSYPYVGGFRLLAPMLIINDLELIRRVLIENFDKFAGRGMIVFEDTEKLSGNLFTLDGDRWKDLRIRLNHVFTPSKLKCMLLQVIECSAPFGEYFSKLIENRGGVVECTEPLSRFTMNAIGLCFFGLKLAELEREDDPFKIIGKKIFDLKVVPNLIKETSPGLFKILRLSTQNKEVEKFFVDTIRDTIDQRVEPRGDFIDTLISMKNNNDTNKWKFTLESLAAQAVSFFAAGFETNSMTISLALFELAYQPETMKKLREEISNTMKDCGGEFTYHVITQMKYLDMVVQETLRKNPPGGMLMRQALENYELGAAKLKIKKGTFIFIPTYAIHHDPQYFPDPETFNPERFAKDEGKNNRNSMAHLPFGAGPKHCVGQAFALLVTKVGIITILKNYRVEPSHLTPMPFEIDASSLLSLKVKGGVYLKFVREELVLAQ